MMVMRGDPGKVCTDNRRHAMIRPDPYVPRAVPGRGSPYRREIDASPYGGSRGTPVSDGRLDSDWVPYGAVNGKMWSRSPPPPIHEGHGQGQQRRRTATATRMKRSRSPSPFYEGQRRGAVVDKTGRNPPQFYKGERRGAVSRMAPRMRSRTPPPRYEGARRREGAECVDLSHRYKNNHPMERMQRYGCDQEGRVEHILDDAHRSGNRSPKGSRGEYFNGPKRVGSDEGNMVQMRMATDREIIRTQQDRQRASNYEGNGKPLLPEGTSRIEDRRGSYGSSHLGFNQALDMDPHELGDKPPSYSGDMSYIDLSNPHFINYEGSSSELMDGGYHPAFQQGSKHLYANNARPKSSKLTVNSLPDAYDRHSPHDTSDRRRNTRNTTHGHRKTSDFCPHPKYLYSTTEGRENGEPDFQSNDGYSDLSSGSGGVCRQKGLGGIKRIVGKEYRNMHTDRGDHYQNDVIPNFTKHYDDMYSYDRSIDDIYQPVPISAHQKDILLDPQPSFDHRSSPFHANPYNDGRDSQNVASSNYEAGDVTFRIRFDHHHEDATKTNITDSRKHLFSNGIREDIMERRCWSRSYFEEQDDEEYYNMPRTVATLDRKVEYVDNEMYYPEVSNAANHHGSYFDSSTLEIEHGYGRGRSRESDRRKKNFSIGSEYDVDYIPTDYDMVVDRSDGNRQRPEEDFSFHGASLVMSKKNLVSSKRTSKQAFGSGTSSGRHHPNQVRYLPGRGEVWLQEGMVRSSSKSMGSYDTQFKKSRSIFDRLGRPQDLSNCAPPKGVQGHFTAGKHELGHIKSHTKSNYQTLNGANHSSKISPPHKNSKGPKTTTAIGCTEDKDKLEDVELPLNAECGDDSEQFEQSVQKAFLFISQKMNESLATRRRYQGLGKAGTLFCIVCKRSNSKEFKNTRDLAAHALTCQTPGLRPQHLGLFKAICVLLGWNSDLDQETACWTPDYLSEAKALAQKEDLICWPPVFILHNTSLARKNPAERKVLKAEELEALFRGKGFISGKVKVLPGQSANGIMVVKFLGTFSGLQDAEKIHKYYAENKRGRVEYGCQGCPMIDNPETPSNTTSMPDLYGYLGISEDWEKLDIESKNRCMLMSKKEILDFAVNPV